MYVALALNLIFLAYLVYWAVLLIVYGGWAFAVIPFLFVLIGLVGLRPIPHEPWRRPEPVDVTRAERAIARLSSMADIRVPNVQGERDGPPLSWTTALPWQEPRVRVTAALLEQLDDRELEAALAHDVSHIANRDAAIMTVLAAPGISVLRGLRNALYLPGESPASRLNFFLFGLIYALPAVISAGLARIVSRHRELAADRGAAMLTGSPAAVTAVLLRVSGEIAVIPKRDLRVAAANDLLNLVPVRPERGIRRLWATHPRLTARVRQLEQLEERLQALG